MSLSSNDYIVYIVSDDFWTRTESMPTIPTINFFDSKDSFKNSTTHLKEIRDRILNNQTTSESSQLGVWYEALENKECIQGYAHEFLSDRRTIVITTASNKTLGKPFGYGYEYSPDSSWYHPYPW